MSNHAEGQTPFGCTCFGPHNKDSATCPISLCFVDRTPFWTGPGYRGEYNCPHGVGHGLHIHGCDGCCSRPDFPLKGAVDRKKKRMRLAANPQRN